ncbi:hypothetical protein CRG98_005936 [Punica granatum]|uniref:RNase H type-1 domain-containing protein n=1 Tax=Punica granatum TaxID=22663 RepID=A0A2I0KYZ7_PUNGR|nr:hypothetical protein CRG98_005936 [Punica granatum]
MEDVEMVINVALASVVMVLSNVQGLSLAANLNIRRLIVEMDAKLIIEWVVGADSPNLVLKDLIAECRTMCRLFEEIAPRHIYREANCAAPDWKEIIKIV